MRPEAGRSRAAAVAGAWPRWGAGLALALFVAWWTLVAGVVGALCAVAWSGRWAGGAALAGAVLCLWVAARVVYRVWPAAGRAHPPTPLPLAAAPGLVATVAEVCRASGRPRPPLVAIVAEANAYAGRLPRWRPGAAADVIAVGIGLLAILDVPTLRTVLAHELGHHRDDGVVLGRRVYRARGALLRAHPRSAEGHVLAPFFRWYARLFLSLTSAMSRQHELDADAHAARVVSAAYTAEALRRVSQQAPLWDGYWRGEVVPLLDAGFVPPLLDGFDRYRRGATPPAAPEPLTADPHDSHPPLADRLAALGDPPPPSPGEPLAALVSDRRALEEAAVASALAAPGRVRFVDQFEPAAPGEVVLVRVGWDDVAARVWLPRYAAEVQAWGGRLGIDTIRRVPHLAGHPGELSACLAARGPRVLSPLAAHRRHIDLLAQGLVVLLVRAGWQAEAPPGAPLVLVRGAERVNPWTAVREATVEGWPGQLGGWLGAWPG